MVVKKRREITKKVDFWIVRSSDEDRCKTIFGNLDLLRNVVWHYRWRQVLLSSVHVCVWLFVWMSVCVCMKFVLSRFFMSFSCSHIVQIQERERAKPICYTVCKWSHTFWNVSDTNVFWKTNPWKMKIVFLPSLDFSWAWFWLEFPVFRQVKSWI